MRLIAVFCAALIGLGSVSSAQEPAPVAGVVVVDTDALYRGTRYGQRIAADFEVRADTLRAENERLMQALTAEEQSLTSRRPTMDPDAFRAEAEEFDTRVQGIRRSRDAAIATYEADLAAAPRAFRNEIREILAELMVERGAVAILDERIVFYSLPAADITQSAIARIDAVLGDGPEAAEN